MLCKVRWRLHPSRSVDGKFMLRKRDLLEGGDGFLGRATGMGTGLRDQEDVEAMEVVGLMAVAISMVVVAISSLIMEVGVAIGEDRRAVEEMDIRGLTMVLV